LLLSFLNYNIQGLILMYSIPNNPAFSFSDEPKAFVPESGSSQPRGSIVFRAVRWFKAEGDSETVQLWRHVAAIALAVILAISLIGIPFLIEGIHLWNMEKRVQFYEESNEVSKSTKRPPFGHILAPSKSAKENEDIKEKPVLVDEVDTILDIKHDFSFPVWGESSKGNVKQGTVSHAGKAVLQKELKIPVEIPKEIHQKIFEQIAVNDVLQEKLQEFKQKTLEDVFKKNDICKVLKPFKLSLEEKKTIPFFNTTPQKVGSCALPSFVQAPVSQQYGSLGERKVTVFSSGGIKNPAYYPSKPLSKIVEVQSKEEDLSSLDAKARVSEKKEETSSVNFPSLPHFSDEDLYGPNLKKPEDQTPSTQSIIQEVD
jgi:hypothetical protein